MAHKFLAACCLLLCLYLISAERTRGNRNDRFKPRKTTTTTTTESTSPATVAPTGSRSLAAEGRKAASRTASENRRETANKRVASEGRADIPEPIVVVKVPKHASAGKGENLPGVPIVPEDEVVVIGGYNYTVCRGPEGDTLIPIDFYICCDGVYFQNTDKTDPKVCCGKDYYLPSTEICCVDKFYKKIDEDTGLPATCCGDVYYIRDIEVCCNGEYDDKFAFGCCNKQFYSLDTTECCNGVEHQRHGGFKCCNTYYGPSDFICCNNLPYHSFFYSCCHNKNQYIPSTHHCCADGSVLSHGNICGFPARK